MLLFCKSPPSTFFLEHVVMDASCQSIARVAAKIGKCRYDCKFGNLKPTLRFQNTRMNGQRLWDVVWQSLTVFWHERFVDDEMLVDGMEDESKLPLIANWFWSLSSINRNFLMRKSRSFNDMSYFKEPGWFGFHTFILQNGLGLVLLGCLHLESGQKWSLGKSSIKRL